MTIHVIEPQVTEIYNYSNESKIAFFSDVAEWLFFLSGDAEYGFRIWGECIKAGKGSTFSLDEILLNDALTNIDLANDLGQAVALCIWQQSVEESDTYRAALILECILRSVKVDFTTEHLGDEKHYMFDLCPLCAAIDRAETREIELAHRALNALLTSAILFIDSKLSLHMLTNFSEKHNIALVS